MKQKDLSVRASGGDLHSGDDDRDDCVKAGSVV